jgi:C4-dicarboxylate transporter DctM subunit
MPRRAATGQLAEKLKAIAETWPVMLIFVAVIGGIYGGFFTPTEAASIGTLATAFVAWRRAAAKRGFLECVYGTSQATAMIFLILLGADIMNVFLALTQMPAELAKWVVGLGFRRCW